MRFQRKFTWISLILTLCLVIGCLPAAALRASAEEPAAVSEETPAAEEPAAEETPAAEEPSASQDPPAEMPPTAMYRLLCYSTGEHLYTANTVERDHLMNNGWRYEGVAWYAPAISATPVYRLFNPYSTDHHYTTDANERRVLIEGGWNDEGIAWYSDDQQRVPMYRAFLPGAQTGAHHYTADLYEYNSITAASWNAEGIAWYGVSGRDPWGIFAIAPNTIVSTWVEGNTYEVSVYHPLENNGVSGVKIAIWSEGHGQDDLQWYNAETVGDGVWSVRFSADDRMENGTCIAGVYATANGQDTGIGEVRFGMGGVSYKGTWVNRYGHWYRYDENSHLLEVRDTPPKVIYLTFDDGPGPHTNRLLDILDKYNVKATFFVTGAMPGYADCMTREAAAGHAMAVHTYTHDYARIYASTGAFWADQERIQTLLEQKTGSRTRLMRFPGGSSNQVSRNYSRGIMTTLARQTAERGMVYFDWNVASGDAGATTDSGQVYRNIINGVSGKTEAVVLCHDSKGYTVDAMERVIKWGLENGYAFMPLTESSPTAHHPIAN